MRVSSSDAVLGGDLRLGREGDLPYQRFLVLLQLLLRAGGIGGRRPVADSQVRKRVGAASVASTPTAIRGKRGTLAGNANQFGSRATPAAPAQRRRSPSLRIAKSLSRRPPRSSARLFRGSAARSPHRNRETDRTSLSSWERWACASDGSSSILEKRATLWSSGAVSCFFSSATVAKSDEQASYARLREEGWACRLQRRNCAPAQSCYSVGVSHAGPQSVPHEDRQAG